MTKRSNTRTRLLDLAEAAVLEKGFEATSIEELVVGAEITKGGFFYHFPDKNALARALLERYIAVENTFFDETIARARQFHDDPLQVLLISIEMIAQSLDDIPNGHPGCLVATAAYQERLFDAEVRKLNRNATLGWRAYFRPLIEDVTDLYTPRDALDIDALSDMVISAIEGGLVLSKALGDPTITGRQVRLCKDYFKLLFSPRLQ